VRQVDLVQRDLVDLDVDGEAGVLHRVAGEVLHAGEDVALQPTGQRCAELTDVVRVLAVGLLGPAPRRVAQEVDAHRAREVRPGRAQLATDGIAHPLLELGVPGGPAGHRHREARVVADEPAPRVISRLCEVTRRAVDAADEAGIHCVGGTLELPGLVDPRSETLFVAPNLHWFDADLASLVDPPLNAPSWTCPRRGPADRRTLRETDSR